MTLSRLWWSRRYLYYLSFSLQLTTGKISRASEILGKALYKEGGRRPKLGATSLCFLLDIFPVTWPRWRWWVREIWIAGLYRLLRRKRETRKYKNGNCLILLDNNAGRLRGVLRSSWRLRVEPSNDETKGNLGYWLGRAKIHSYDRDWLKYFRAKYVSRVENRRRITFGCRKMNI